MFDAFNFFVPSFNTARFFNFPIKLSLSKKVKFQIHIFIGKTTYVIGKVIKKYITVRKSYYYM